MDDSDLPGSETDRNCAEDAPVSSEPEDLFNLTDERDPEYIPDSSDEDTDSEADDAMDSSGGKFRMVGISYQCAPTVTKAGKSLGTKTCRNTTAPINRSCHTITTGNVSYPHGYRDTDYVSGSSDGESITYDFPQLAAKSEDTPNLGNSGANTSSSVDNCPSATDKSIKIAKASGKSGAKYHYCVFCEKPQSRLPRHLETCHRHEKGMIKYLNANGKQKKAELSKLRNAGDYHHNLAVKKAGKGEYVAKRSKRDQCASPSKYVHCPACLGFFQKIDLYRHSCPAGEKGGPRRQLAKKGQLLLPEKSVNSQEFGDMVRAFWGDMQQDKVLLSAKNDNLINAAVRALLKKKGNDKQHFNTIRNTARELGRLLIELRDISYLPNAGLADFLKPEHFRTVVNATKRVAGYNEKDCTFETPSLAKKIGHSLSFCGDILETRAIESRDEVLENSSKQFLKLHKKRWHEEISSHADRTLHKKKRGTHKRIPLCRDVAKLSRHLQDKAQQASEKLRCGITDRKKAWVDLAETTLAQTFLFNRRRQREVSTLKLTDLHQVSNHDPDILKTLTPFEQQLCKKLTRVEVFGKRGRIVPILLTNSMKTSIDLLNKHRSDAGVSQQNEYVFACANFSSEGFLRGSDALRKAVKTVQLSNPELITGTNLRKQVATLSQVVNLRDNELDILAQYMGHDIQIHREVYRMPSETMQLAKISKLLIALDKGALPQNSSLEDIEIGEEDDVFSDSDSEMEYEPETSTRVSSATVHGKKQRDVLSVPADPPENDHNELEYVAETSSRAHSATVHGKKRLGVLSVPPAEPPEEGINEVEFVPETSSRAHSTTVHGKKQRGVLSVPADPPEEGVNESDDLPDSSSLKTSRAKWSTEEEAAVRRHLGKYILTQTIPGKKEITLCISKEPILQGKRNWLHVKNFIRNKITSLSRSKNC